MFNIPARDSLNDLSPYIPGRQAEDVKKEFKLKEVIKLASNENPLGASPQVLAQISEKIKLISIYPDQHSTALKNSLSQKFGVNEKRIIIGNGSDEIMLMAALALLNAGDEVIISKNTFSTYDFAAKLMDAKPIYADLKKYTYDLDKMLELISKKTKLIFLCNPNNPTGTIFQGNKLKKFLKNVPDNALVILDEAYGEYCQDPKFISGIEFLDDYKNVIVLKTFSKIYGLAALRVGYGLGNENIIKYLDLVKLPFNANFLGQIGALAALKDDEFVKKSIELNNEGKEYLYNELEILGLEFVKTQANFIFIKVKDADETFLKMMSQGVIIRPLTTFGFCDAIRVTIGTKEQNETFISALRNAL